MKKILITFIFFLASCSQPLPPIPTLGVAPIKHHNNIRHIPETRIQAHHGPSSCIAEGDSIAYGVAGPLGCLNDGHVGWSSTKIVNIIFSTHYSLCVFSAGSNDPSNPLLNKNLEAMIEKSSCDRRVFILPINSRARSVVETVASQNGAETVSFVPGPDNVHPKSYGVLASAIRR